MAVSFFQDGPVNPHIIESLGGLTNPFNHYSTTYKRQYGKHWIHSEMFRETQPGLKYLWCKRPYIGYRSSLDNHDNLSLQSKLINNYVSITKKHFTKPMIKTAENSLSHINNLIIPQGYLFHTELTVPRRMHNPNDWTTHYTSEYNGKTAAPIDFHRDPIGKKELSGCSINNPIIHTLSFLPHSTYRNDWPKNETNRPTGKTIYSTDYNTYSIPDGSEPLPEITYSSDRSSGFVKGNQQRPDFVPSSQEIIKPKTYSPNELEFLKKSDPIEYLNAIHPNSDPSVKHATYTDPRAKVPTEEEILDRINVGNKERTGFVANQINYIQTKDDPNRFITHNMTKFYDPVVAGFERYGHVEYNVNETISNGFVKNNGISTYSEVNNSLNKCSEMDSYQFRSFSKRDYVAK